jgi:putative hydrolase of the HAD superfamily
MLNQPVDLLPGVKETLSTLKKNYRLLLITKGDLLDQEKKVVKSGLEEYFHHVEVLSNKHSKNYKDLLDHLSIPATEFLMVGNSLKSDILPLLEIGARAIHIPFHTTWEHENVDHNRDSDFITLSRFSDLLDVL